FMEVRKSATQTETQIKDTTLYAYGTGALSDVLDHTTTYKSGSMNSQYVSDPVKSAVYYKGALRGEELSDYTLNYSGNSAGNVSTSTVYYYGDSKQRAGSVTVSSTRMSVSETYNGDKSAITTTYQDNTIGAELKTRTYYFGYKGEELASLSHSVMLDSNDNYLVRDTTVYAYLASSDVLGYTTTYKGGTIANSKDSIGPAKSYVKYQGILRGEELSDYMLSYSGTGTAVSTSTVYYYGTSHYRAGSALSYIATSTPMTAAETYIGDMSAASINYKSSPATDLRSKTHYVGYKGEELADYAQSFMVDGVTRLPSIKDTTIYTYASGDVLSYSTTYKNGTMNSNAIPSVMKSRVYYKGGLRGEELSDYAFNYSGTGSTISTTTLYYYGTGNWRASSALQYRPSSIAMTSSESYVGDQRSHEYCYNMTPATDLKSKTHYFGYKGDELAEFSQNFTVIKTGNNAYDKVVRDTTLYSYASGDVLDNTTTYKDGAINVGAGLGVLKGYTKYRGNLRGEELSDYNLVYSGNTAEDVSMSTVYYYGTDSSMHARAEDAVALSIYTIKMTASETYYGDKSADTYQYTAGLNAAVDLKTKTHYFGYKGDELTDYSQSF
ncbi:MAG TPA: hypothetical protein PLV52_05705, partial [Candidatus Omnitrophota bacterium]|nr:hypothetical protein [Candidatus Omnitrophota bacterium]